MHFEAGNPGAQHAPARLTSFDEKSQHANSSAYEKSGGPEVIRLEQIETSSSLDTNNNKEDPGAPVLYRNGQLIRQPAPTRDPKDPLNLSFKRKCILSLCLCFFGALAAAAELVLGAMLPVFALEYAGIDPKNLLAWSEMESFLPKGSDPLASLENLGGPPIWKIYLLASAPVLVIGVSNLVLIPLSISVGRRAVILISGVVAITGAVWAGFSQSLGSHLAARCFQAVGAGTIESLIPFIIQDMVFVHERNTWISFIFAAQGVIIIAIGFASPWIIINLSWRWVYYLTAAVATFFLSGVFLFLPETRWPRTTSELNGFPRDDAHVQYSPRTWKWDLALFHGRKDWRKGWNSFMDTIRTFFYPQIFFITMLNSAMIATAFGAAYTVSPALLSKPWAWPFLHLGFALVPILIAAFFVAGITGSLADWLANMAAKKRGRRIPENQLFNLILPTLSALIGSVIFGVVGENTDKYHWSVFLFALGLMSFGFLGANTIGAVYVLECYPHLAGPALVNIASFRHLIAFVLSFKVSEWVANLGYLRCMMIYTGIMSVFAFIFLPIVMIWGPAWRRRWPADGLGEQANR